MSAVESRDRPKKLAALIQVAVLLVGVVGFAASDHGTFALVAPVGFALVAGAVFSKLVRSTNKPMIPASAILAGHALWLFLGVIILFRFDSFFADVAILFGGAACVAFYPTIAVVALVSCYQLLGIALIGEVFCEATTTSRMQMGLFVHLALRVLSIVLMIYGIAEVRKRRQPAARDALSGDAERPIVDVAQHAEPGVGADSR